MCGDEKEHRAGLASIPAVRAGSGIWFALCAAFVMVIFLTVGQVASAEPTWCSRNPGAIFCHDFDRNCTSPPADPNEACPEDSPRSDPRLRAIWVNNSYNYNTSSYCGSDMCGEEVPDSPIPGMYYEYILPSHPFGGRHANGGDESGQLGQNTVDLTSYVTEAMPGHTVANGTDEHPLVLTFTMGSLALGAMQFNNGYMELSYGDPDRWNPVTDVAKAPTNFVLVGGGSTCLTCNAGCPAGTGSESVVAWPTICQQEFPNTLCPPKQDIIRSALAVGALALLDNNPCHCCPNPIMPNGAQPWRTRCPVESRTPEFPDGWQEPTNVHLSFFDGREWRVLRAGMGGPGSYGDFRYGNYWIYLETAQGVKGNTAGAWETVVLTVKTSTVDVYHKTKNVTSDGSGGYIETWVESLAKDLPRYYTGGFNRLRAGTDESCKLNNDTHTCNNDYANGHKKCKVMKEERCDGGNATFRASYVAFDNVGLFGGEGNLEMGACCTSDGGCEETDPITCASVRHGSFRGVGTTCGDGSICSGACCVGVGCTETLQNQCSGAFLGSGTSCGQNQCPCPNPFADADGDEDVDQADFAVFQTCYTGSNDLASPWPGVPQGCQCFDHVAVGTSADAVDQLDFEAFEACSSGPGLAADSNCDGAP